jgi:hypothetical protein
MKYLKIIGLAALAAMALTAFAASSASAATTICSTTGTGSACKSGHGNIYTGSVVAKNSGNVILSVTNKSGSVINTVTSTSSEVQGTVNGATATGNITKMTFAGLSSSLCSSVTATTTASEANPWPSTVTTELATENTNGIMTTSNVTGSFTCTFLGLPVTCKYKTSSAKTKVVGSDTEPKVVAESISLEADENNNESVCGVAADWKGTYKVSTPASLFVE